MRRIGTLDEYHHLQFSLLTLPEVCWNMALFMTNIENKYKKYYCQLCCMWKCVVDSYIREHQQSRVISDGAPQEH